MVKSLSKNSDSYTTIYKKDFLGIPTAIPKPIYHRTDFDAICTPYLEVLLPEEFKNSKKTLDKEPVNVYFERLIQEKPKLTRHIPSSPSHDILIKEVTLDGKTIYQKDYRFEGIQPVVRQTSRIKLADDWVIPTTTKERSYRDFRSIVNFDLTVQPIKPPLDNLAPKENLRKIRQVRTGDSEYQHIIGSLGGEINKEEYYGPTRRYSNEIFF